MELIYYFVYCCSPPQRLNSVFRAHYSTSHLLNNALSVAFSYLHNENSSSSEKDERNDWDEEVIQVGQVYPCCILTRFTYPTGHICIQQWRGTAENTTKKIRIGKCVSVQRRFRAACIQPVGTGCCSESQMHARLTRDHSSAGGTRPWGNMGTAPQEGHGMERAGAWENFTAEITGVTGKSIHPTFS